MGLTMAFVGGTVYYDWYKKKVLDKIEQAFEGGYDPALELVVHSKLQGTDRQLPEAIDELDIEEGPWTEHLRRREQDILDKIIHGIETGHYFMLLGSKGAGKTTMVLDAMQRNQAEGVAMCDAHPDLEVFRLRMGKALNYEFNEDTQTGLFQRRDPREGNFSTPHPLPILNKLEKVALRRNKKTGKPLVLVINNVHYFKNDESGQSMLMQLQQRAEAWAASGAFSLVYKSRVQDDFWPFIVLRKHASRMSTLTIYDLAPDEAASACRDIRRFTRLPTPPMSVIEKATSIVGGRLSYLNRVARSRDMVEIARHMLSVEKGWLLSQIGLIDDCDDDVMDEQKWSSCSWLLLKEFVKVREEQERETAAQIEAGELPSDAMKRLPLPAIPYHMCRQIMTRADFLEELDRLNVISIDIHHDVRPDSMLILEAARAVVNEEGFDELLESVRNRINDIESLHRTRELTFKDLPEDNRIYLTIVKGGSPERRV
ncbi:hypothetical protein K488DRAFT_76181 [Vararia minispora EC-137]|uniref:Uncharacterized protein n=1 Tax=Vararia minispora EC-137 TaxID=1314806 RepID=A0ACB8QY15_9AGAM|nr:hypothetical protein K488DRAFT_76181 [Vararia minispora EC-137]